MMATSPLLLLLFSVSLAAALQGVFTLDLRFTFSEDDHPISPILELHNVPFTPLALSFLASASPLLFVLLNFLANE